MSTPPGVETLIVQSPTVSTVTVVTDRGPAGQRGSFIYSAAGHPSQFVDNNGDVYYMFDDPSKYLGLDDLYLDESTNRVYRWSAGPGTFYWQDTSAGANIYAIPGSVIDFAQAVMQTCAVSGNLTFTSTNEREGAYIRLLLINTSGSTRTLAWPAGFKWSAGAAPLSIRNNQTIEVSLLSTTALATGVYGSWNIVEYDGKVSYTNPNVSTGQALVASEHLLISGADLTLSNVNTAQSLFAAANDTITVPASTAYYFECEFHQTGTGTTSHTLQFGFGGTATTHDIQYQAYVAQNATSSATPTPTAHYAAYIATAAATAITAATATAIYRSVRIRGTIRVNASGTLIPQITFSAAPGVAPVIKRGAIFRLIPVGTAAAATANVIGAWS